MNNAQIIAHTILQQIGVNALMCLGVPHGSKVALGETSETLGGVRFKFTNCFKIRNGIVEVLLEASDTYRVIVRNQLGNVKSDCDGLYNEDLSGHLMRVIGY